MQTVLKILELAKGRKTYAALACIIALVVGKIVAPGYVTEEVFTKALQVLIPAAGIAFAAKVEDVRKILRALSGAADKIPEVDAEEKKD